MTPTERKQTTTEKERDRRDARDPPILATYPSTATTARTPLTQRRRRAGIRIRSNTTNVGTGRRRRGQAPCRVARGGPTGERVCRRGTRPARRGHRPVWWRAAAQGVEAVGRQPVARCGSTTGGDGRGTSWRGWTPEAVPIGARKQSCTGVPASSREEGCARTRPCGGVAARGRAEGWPHAAVQRGGRTQPCGGVVARSRAEGLLGQGRGRCGPLNLGGPDREWARKARVVADLRSTCVSPRWTGGPKAKSGGGPVVDPETRRSSGCISEMTRHCSTSRGARRARSARRPPPPPPPARKAVSSSAFTGLLSHRFT